MYAHNLYQNQITQEQPIKNDYDSQALPSNEEWDTMRSPNKNYEQQNQQTIGQYLNQLGGGGAHTPQYASSIQQQRNFQMAQPMNQNVVNEPSSEYDQFHSQYKGTGNIKNQGEGYYHQPQQLQGSGQNQYMNQIQSTYGNGTKLNNNFENGESPQKMQSQKKNSLAIQTNDGNLNFQQQPYQKQNNNQYGGVQEINYGNPLGTQSVSQRSISQFPKTEYQQVQQQNQQNSQLYQKQIQQQQQSQLLQQQQKLNQIQLDRTQMNNTIMDNYNDNSPIRDMTNVNNTQYNIANQTQADIPLITPPKQRIEQPEVLNKIDLNASNNLPNINLQQQLEMNQNNIYKIQDNNVVLNNNQIYLNEEGIKDRNSTTYNFRETTQVEGAPNQQQRLNYNINQRVNNYSGMYAYVADNKNQINNTTQAYLAYEPSKNVLGDQIGKIINVDDPNFHQNLDLQQQNFNLLLQQKLTPLEIEFLRRAQRKQNTSFFYDKLAKSYRSVCIPDYKRPFYKFFLFEFIIPIIIVFLLHVFLWGVQYSINDYCFQSSSVCQCKNFSIQLWTFFRQMIAWKLGVICCKNILMIEIGQERFPLMESFMMFFVSIGVDFIMVVGIGLNQDWQFYLMIFVLGYIMTIHVIKFKQFTKIRTKGRGLYLYDLNLVAIIVFIYYALPAIYKSLIDRLSFSNGRSTFLLLYPLLEWVFEIFSNMILDKAKLATFFQYQMYMLILGMRVGIMTSTSTSNFEFWYLGTLFFLKRILESSSFVYINLRRLIYKMFPPNLKYKASMSEYPDYKKGREGFYMESIVWIGMYYWWFYTNTIVPGYVKSYIVVNNCEFQATNIFRGVTWDRPFFTWIFFLVATIISYFVNFNLKYDMIKWIGAQKHNFIENILTRMFGWYLFQVALIVSYSISQEYAQTYSNF
ncbi:transmembrane protein, putative (macronuclear) [Tetrahymena thermophila SB210]|uniref:Transmembrane protein, putative n=1 Tax=Tetrahymena thermophila (strain SB210) TaxID=312017 RepID=Q22ZB4_TETTS|nr:transmembrane protein, putative [Tetrahymena thermophila SB210]EAR90407.3 transmembrane protein, putative [Tetrahymena thermophila SB210]|eukprot:XP_001010652.3 transmembrane protein, putative [Tetrahymena thermophila SB210]